MSQSAAPTPATSASPTSKPSPAKIVLAGTGVAGLPFGTDEAQVLATVTAVVGKATETHQGQTCELNASSPWGENVIYGDVWMQFTAKDKKKASPRTLTAWGYPLGNPLPSKWAIADNVPLNLSFTQLKAKYPGSKTVPSGFDDGSITLVLPNEIGFYGAGTPELVTAGAVEPCE